MAFRTIPFLLFFLLSGGPRERHFLSSFSSLQRVLALSLSTAGAPEASLWVASGPRSLLPDSAGSSSKCLGSSPSGGLRIGANLLHKWAGGFQTRLQLSADALAAAAGLEAAAAAAGVDGAAGGATGGSYGRGAAAAAGPRKKGSCWASNGSNGSSFLSTFCEAVEICGEALAAGSGRRIRTLVRLDFPTGRSKLLCAAADGNHEIVGQFSPALGPLPAAASLSSSHLFRGSKHFLKIQPTHDFTSKVSQLRVQGGLVPQQQPQQKGGGGTGGATGTGGGGAEAQQWTEVDLHVEKQHVPNTWDGTVGLRQVFDGGRVSFAPYLCLKDRSLRYEYCQNLGSGGSLTAVLQPAHWLRVLWRDPSASGGFWVAHAEIPLHKGSRGLKDGTLSFRREWTL